MADKKKDLKLNGKDLLKLPLKDLKEKVVELKKELNGWSK